MKLSQKVLKLAQLVETKKANYETQSTLESLLEHESWAEVLDSLADCADTKANHDYADDEDMKAVFLEIKQHIIEARKIAEMSI